MIKYFVSNDCLTQESDINVAWVTKREISTDSKSVIGIEFHKVTPRIKEVIDKNVKAEDILKK